MLFITHYSYFYLHFTETLEYIKPVVDLANEVLWHWKTFPIILPPPIETKIEPAAGELYKSSLYTQ